MNEGRRRQDLELERKLETGNLELGGRDGEALSGERAFCGSVLAAGSDDSE
jgi:hypothetical protein